MLFTLCVYHILNASVPGLSYATYHLCKWLECRWSNRRRYSYELGTCWSSFWGLQTLLQEAFSNQSEESSYIHIIIIYNSSTFGVALMRLQKSDHSPWLSDMLKSFLQVFGLQKSDMPSNAPLCFTDLNFIDDKLYWYFRLTWFPFKLVCCGVFFSAILAFATSIRQCPRCPSPSCQPRSLWQAELLEFQHSLQAWPSWDSNLLGGENTSHKFPKVPKKSVCYIYLYIWVFPEMVVPPKHPKMIIFSRKTNGCWVPSFQETPIYTWELLHLLWWEEISSKASRGRV